MEKLFSPWRSKYIATFKDEKPRKGESLFTRILKEKNDAKNLVLARKKHCFVMMNLFPYNSGHVLIVPYKQTPNFSGLTKEEYAEIMQTAVEIMKALDVVMKPHGFNFGANIGRVAGAGIDDHVHFHIVPRWNGDTNFMPVLGDIKVVSEDIKQTFKKIKTALQLQTAKKKR